MGCNASKPGELCGLKFQYYDIPIHSQLDNEHTYKYRNIEVLKAIRFPRITIHNSYPMLLYFMDKDVAMLCCDGAAILLQRLPSMEVEDSDASFVTKATVTWALIAEYDWVLPRLRRMKTDPIITSIIDSVSTLVPTAKIKQQIDHIRQQALVVEKKEGERKVGKRIEKKKTVQWNLECQ